MTTTATEPATRKGGRPSAGADRLVLKPIRLVQSDWDWLALWRPGSDQDAMRDLVERARKMFPEGPDRFGHTTTKKARQRLPSAFLKAFAEERGIRVEDAPAVALREYAEMLRSAKEA